MVIETERLRLRPLGPVDLDEFITLQSAPEVAEWFGPAIIERARERLGCYEHEWARRGHGLMAILDRGSGRFLGRTGLKYWPQFDETEVGWVLHRSVWGHGYATEAGAACLAWGFQTFSLPYITAMIRPDNERSIAVAQRLGLDAIRQDELFGEPLIVHAVRRERWSSVTR